MNAVDAFAGPDWDIDAVREAAQGLAAALAKGKPDGEDAYLILAAAHGRCLRFMKRCGVPKPIAAIIARNAVRRYALILDRGHAC